MIFRWRRNRTARLIEQDAYSWAANLLPLGKRKTPDSSVDYFSVVLACPTPNQDKVQRRCNISPSLTSQDNQGLPPDAPDCVPYSPMNNDDQLQQRSLLT
jgi:hypothetical protein